MREVTKSQLLDVTLTTTTTTTTTILGAQNQRNNQLSEKSFKPLFGLFLHQHQERMPTLITLRLNAHLLR